MPGDAGPEVPASRLTPREWLLRNRRLVAGDPHVHVRRVVIADDAETDRLAIRRTLRGLFPGVEVIDAEDVGVAVELVTADPPDVLILDFHLATGTAFDVLRSLTVTRGTLVCPVVVFTGETDMNMALRLLRAGVGDFLRKSPSPEGMAENLMRAILHARERYRLTRRTALSQLSLLRKRRQERLALEEARVSRKASEQAHERLDLSLDAADLGVWDWSPATGDVRHNDRLLKMLGYDPGDVAFTYTLWRSLLHPDDVPRAAEALEGHLFGGNVDYRIEFRLRCKDGRYKWILSSGRTVERDDQGRPVRVAGVHMDIDSRKRAELALFESKQHAETVQQQLVDILTSINDAFVFIDRNWRYTYVNPSAEGYLRRSAGRIVGSVVWDLFPELTGTEFERGMRQAMEGSWSEVTAFFTPLGRWFSCRFYPAGDGITIFFLDVTPEKEHERQLAEKNAQLQQRTAQLNALLANAPLGFGFFDLDLHFLRLNRVLADMTGLPVDAHYSRTLADVIPLWKTAWQPSIRQVFEAARPVAGLEVHQPAPGAGARWFRCDFFPVTGDDGKVLAAGVVVIDVTERRSAEQQLLQAKERAERERQSAESARENAEQARVSAERAKEIAERASNAKSEFLAVLSHELRTPLTPVLAGAQLLEEELADAEREGRRGNVGADTAETLAMIRRNVELEVRLIDDLLDLTRITRGKLQLSRKPVNLNETVRHVIEICTPDLEAKGLQLEHHLKADPAGVFADPARLRQVLWNLVKNAVKFTPPGGTITLGTANVQVPTHDGVRRTVTCTVADTGVGIPADVLPSVFNAFEQGGERVTRTFGGLGLGLAISRALVTAQGGTLVARSEGQDRGAAFTLSLPMREVADPAPLRRPQVSRRSIRGARVLLVEDHVDTAKLMSRFLRVRLGLQVDVVHRVADAFAAVRSRPSTFDLVVSDIGLPDGAGTDLLDRMAAEGLDPPPAIALSGYGTEADVQRSLAAGFQDHLTKPVDLERLAAAVRRILVGVEPDGEK